ncbi:WhiB family transcriptional regulator [Rhodococcus rhodochrous]|uniref:Transcriptional regulator WhiB n=2 Tax=Nocardiaceae TaxID=85025 RepID=A0AA47ADQ3_RHORH|nr:MULTISPECIES: WhiB family transcriptional regulator [Rhodococcus]MBF4479968.1 WhiB family transcriptional regulator [Rhodococcus rhodochrous]MCB8910324.1 WhiB family transcriptional regulator [Rhodococcus rhodochrous]MCD2099922.1 WhiB family transcriptional regulator [Rhodococcus rhodochrous]MCD2122917.1 WhiB family transcriptional regulator [Rhodococcus rhodochrous]MCQ4137164.1 WhiB family transcriptional regulator [Rhodococcus rhodochrous]
MGKEAAMYGSGDRDWVVAARCRGVDTSMFFPQPEDGRGAVLRAERQAKEVCRSCPVIDACREHAVRTGETHGVWGGMNYSERRAFERAMKLGRLQSV